MSEFNEQLIQTLRNDLESIKRRLQYVEQSPDIPYTQVFIAKTGGSGISAMSGSTPSSGTVTLYQLNSSGTLETVKDDNLSDVTVTAYNIAASAVASSTWVQIKQEMSSGIFVIDFEDCGA